MQWRRGETLCISAVCPMGKERNVSPRMRADLFNGEPSRGIDVATTDQGLLWAVRLLKVVFLSIITPPHEWTMEKVESIMSLKLGPTVSTPFLVSYLLGMWTISYCLDLAKLKMSRSSSRCSQAPNTAFFLFISRPGLIAAETM